MLALKELSSFSIKSKNSARNGKNFESKERGKDEEGKAQPDIQ